MPSFHKALSGWGLTGMTLDHERVLQPLCLKAQQTQPRLPCDGSNLMWDKANALLTLDYSSGCSISVALYNPRVGENHPNVLEYRSAAQRLQRTLPSGDIKVLSHSLSVNEVDFWGHGYHCFFPVFLLLFLFSGQQIRGWCPRGGGLLPGAGGPGTGGEAGEEQEHGARLCELGLWAFLFWRERHRAQRAGESWGGGRKGFRRYKREGRDTAEGKEEKYPVGEHKRPGNVEVNEEKFVVDAPSLEVVQTQALLLGSHQRSAGRSPSHFNLRSCHVLQEANFYLKTGTTTICAEQLCARHGAHQAGTETPAISAPSNKNLLFTHLILCNDVFQCI